jgi:hypothetical protein
MATFDCNTGMERIFYTNKNGLPSDLSTNRRFSVYFEIENLCKHDEKRYLRVTKRGTNETLLRVKLRDDIGVKPMNGLDKAYKPKERPFIKTGLQPEIETERVIYAEEDIADDENIAVYLRLTPIGDDSDDIERYLSFIHKHKQAHIFGDEELDLNDAGGKKPLGLGLVME